MLKKATIPKTIYPKRKNYLILIAIPVMMALFTLPCFASDTAEPQEECWICGVKGVPFPDEDINRYVGQIIDPDIISKINHLVEERYPGHSTSFTFKMLDSETECIYLEDGKIMSRPHRMLLTSYLDHGVISPEGQVLELPLAGIDTLLAGPYYYSGTLNSGSGRVHNSHYLVGIYEFESHTSWTPTYADMGIGLYNYNTGWGVYYPYYDSPADDISYNWDYPYYYGFLVVNLEPCTTVSYSGYYYYNAE